MLVFDLEANGFLATVTCIHCLVIKDLNTGQVWKFRPSEVEQGVRQLMQGDQPLVGHNIIEYDLPVIQKIYPWFAYDETRVVDTLVLSRLIWTNLSDLDSKNGRVEPANNGKHKLEAWGQRLGFHKAEYTLGFDAFNEEMLEYNAVDVEVTERLWRHIEKQAVDPRASELEHQVAFIVARQVRHGVGFDTTAAEQFTAELQTKRTDLEAQLQDTFKPFYMAAGVVTPKRTTNGKKVPGTWEGAPYTKIKNTIFNAGSRHHIAHRLKALHNWRPTEFTDGGQPKVDESVLGKLPYPEAKLLAEYFLVQKQLGMLAEGEKAWLKYVTPEGRIHGEVITNGAVTGRATHFAPNLGQVPSADSAYGKQSRALFRPTPSHKLVQVGVDVSGLELRMLAHYLARWDGGSYGKIVCEGDVHTVNQTAAGLTTRALAKTFIYAFLYGAGDIKIGTIVAPTANQAHQRREGKKLKERFTHRTPGLAKLIKAVKDAAKRGYLIGLDGRRLHIRSDHAALNTLLQSAGALICKRWMVEVDLEVKRRNWHNIVQQVLWVHDEIQFEVVPEYAEEFGQVAIECIARAQQFFNIRVPLTGEAKVGNNWKETH